MVDFLKWLRKAPKDNIVEAPKENRGIEVTKGKDEAFHAGFNGSFSNSQFAQAFFGGETVVGGVTNKVDYDNLSSIDYYSLRALSKKLYIENKYAGMAFHRINTNVVNEGLKPESEPAKFVTNFETDDNVKWTEKTEEMFDLWARDKSADWERVQNFSGLQKIAHMESLIEGDILVRLRVDEKTGLPSIKLIPGRHVRNGVNSDKLKAKGNVVEFGVELDKQRRHVAYHIVERGTIGRAGDVAVRILAKGKLTGRTKAFLVYESPPPAGRVRGFPILTRLIQATDQIETYATYELEAAKVNASLAMMVEKNKDRNGSRPMRGVTKKNAEDTIDGVPKTMVQAGMIIQEMAYGEKVTSFKTDRPNVNFKAFKDTVLEDIAAALEIPPEILQLKFGNNFSASRQAEIEFKAYIRKARRYFSDQFHQPIFGQFLFAMVSKGLITAKGYLTAVESDNMFERNGWERCKWAGFVKQHVDILKEAKAYQIYNASGWMTRERAASEITGTSARKNIETLKPENENLADANEPLHGDINTSKSVVSGGSRSTEPQNGS